MYLTTVCHAVRDYASGDNFVALAGERQLPCRPMYEMLKVAEGFTSPIEGTGPLVVGKSEEAKKRRLNLLTHTEYLAALERLHPASFDHYREQLDASMASAAL
jgi:hypothetical protein